ncbi:hypothetical protein VOWphi5012_016 [Vibrio phage phi50-12]|uniref:TMhelix containing protein n=1 Tax=Vibrio phage phi50-12 TaxID=2654972 RepID=A0A5P8PR82_9CAUD|nr:hypothetical protein KNU82_gp016 [Vibrio phage phi50-12]QFR59800.1 hypothetical protein VOWphi5012_016 [Vibrio phage phi50-12]
MGFFSKTVVSTASASMNLVEDTPEVINQAIINASLEGYDAGESLLDTLANSFDNNMRRYQSYGDTTFTLGLPLGQSSTITASLANVQSALDKEFPYTTTAVSGFYEDFNLEFVAISHLRVTNDYKAEDNTINVGGIRYEIAKYIWTDSEPTIVKVMREGFSGILIEMARVTDPLFALEGSDEDEDFINITYFKESELEPYYWPYYIKTNKYPELDPSNDIGPVNQFFPIVPLRLNKQSYTDPDLSDTELYKTSKSLLSKAGIVWKQLDEGINENPDIDDVNHAYIMNAISLETEDNYSKRYLFNYFLDLEAQSGITSDDYEEWEKDSSETTTPPVNTLSITSGTWKSAISYYYIKSKTVESTIGKIGTVDITINAFPRFTPQGFNYSTESVESKVLITRQITDTTCVELCVAGLVYRNEISGSGSFVRIGLDDLGKEDDETEILIPLNLGIVDKMTFTERHYVYYDSFKVVFNAFKKQKLKWYQTGFFKFVTIVIAIAVAVYTGYYQAVVAALSTAAAAGALALAITVAWLVIEAYIVKVTFEFIAKELGVEVAIILAAVLAVYGFGGGLFDLPMANTAVFIGTVGLDSSISYGIERIQAEYEAFQSYAIQKQEELDVVKESLEKPEAAFDIVGMLPMESPTSFYTRKLTTNVAPVTLEAVSSYVDRALTLPTIGVDYGYE